MRVLFSMRSGAPWQAYTGGLGAQPPTESRPESIHSRWLGEGAPPKPDDTISLAYLQAYNASFNYFSRHVHPRGTSSSVPYATLMILYEGV